MESYTLDIGQRTVCDLPEQYVDLAACCMTVVYDLSIGHSDRYQEKVSQLADSYFVLMIEALRSPERGSLATPSVIRFLIQKAVAEDKILAANPHLVQLVDVFFDQFDVRLSTLIATASANTVVLPENGPSDLLVPVFASLLVDRIELVHFDSIQALKASTRDAFSYVSVPDVEDCFVRICRSFVENISMRGAQDSRFAGRLLTFICEYQQLYPETMAARLEPMRRALIQLSALSSPLNQSFTIN